MTVNYIHITSFTIFLIFLAPVIGVQISAAPSPVILEKSGLLVSDPLDNETKTQEQLAAENGYWNYNGDAVAQNANYTFFKDAQGLHLGVQATFDGRYAGFYAKSPSENALLFHAVSSVPVRTIPSNNTQFQSGINVKTSEALINYISCVSTTDGVETKWVVGHTYGTPLSSAVFDTLYVDTSPNQPLARECTIITNGDNYLKVYLDRVLVYSSDTLILGMPAPFDVYLQATNSYGGQLIKATYTDYYVTSGESITVFNSPANATTVTITDQAGNVLASAPMSNGNATINVGQFHFPLNGKINVYDSSNTLIATTPSSVDIFGGDLYSAELTPPPTVPQPPTNLSATSTASSQIDLSWNAPADNGGSPVTGYKIERSTDGGSSWSILVANTNSTSTAYSDIGLAESTTYSYRVYAINSVGISAPSNVATSTTGSPPTVPQPPTNLSATSTSSSQIDLSWSAPSSDGGSAITGNQIERSIDNGTTWNVLVANTASADTAYSDTGLNSTTVYSYRVSAINAIGISAPSNMASATTSSDQPGITLDNLKSTSGRTSATNQVVLPGFDIGMGKDRLLVVGVQASANSVSSITFGGTPLTKAVSSFTGTVAELWYLKNPTGTGDIVVTMNGPASVVVGAYSLTGVDQSNPIPTTSKNSGSTNNPTITIMTQYQNSWVIDSASIYGEVLLSNATCDQKWNIDGVGRPLFPITGASSSTTNESAGLVTCSWTASRSDLWDNVAIELKVAPAHTIPSPPTGLTAVGFSPSQISLNWSAPSSDGGDIITGYQIERSADNATTWSVIVTNTNSTSTLYTDTGLAESTTYSYRLSAINSVGISSTSNVASATTNTQSNTITVYAHRIPAPYWEPCFAKECDAGTGPGASMYFGLLDSSGNLIDDGFADEHGLTFFNLNQTATYYVFPSDCNFCHISGHHVEFEYWGDNQSNVRPRAATTGTSLHAWYSCSNNCFLPD